MLIRKKIIPIERFAVSTLLSFIKYPIDEQLLQKAISPR